MPLLKAGAVLIARGKRLPDTGAITLRCLKLPLRSILSVARHFLEHRLLAGPNIDQLLHNPWSQVRDPLHVVPPWHREQPGSTGVGN
jgi:hypothetical protein